MLLSTGRSSSTPTSDQVPDEMNTAGVEGGSGVPTTADAVSCDATATSSASHLPNLGPWRGVTRPGTVPGCTTGAQIDDGRPPASHTSPAHAPSGASVCVRLALGRSH